MSFKSPEAQSGSFPESRNLTLTRRSNCDLGSLAGLRYGLVFSYLNRGYVSSYTSSSLDDVGGKVIAGWPKKDAVMPLLAVGSSAYSIRIEMVNMARLLGVEVWAENQEVIGRTAEVTTKSLQICRVGDYSAIGGIQA